MDGKKVLEVIGIYRNFFEKLGIPNDKIVKTKRVYHSDNILAHCHGMLDEMEKFVAEGRIDKGFRWLGFIQGCLWSAGHYTLEELKNHNRSDFAD